MCISIHAPARGASKEAIEELESLRNFNSRPCERGFKKAGETWKSEQISIHAPARGAS